MELVLIGKYVNTHGIKGEIRIKSNFNFKERVFKIGNILVINNKEFKIKSYRKHKEYDMVVFEGINNINDILELKGSLVYINRELLNLDSHEYLDSDLINLNVYINDKLVGMLSDIKYITNNKKLLVVNNSYIPFELIKKVDLENKKIIVEEVLGLI